MAKLIILLLALACATVISAQLKDSKDAPKHDKEMIQKFGPTPPHSVEDIEGSARDEHKARPPHRPPHGPNSTRPTPTTILAPEEPETTTADVEVETTTQ